LKVFFYDITGLRFVKSSCHVNVVCSVGFHLKPLIKIVKSSLFSDHKDSCINDKLVPWDDTKEPRKKKSILG
jgi:hypothetical protein